MANSAVHVRSIIRTYTYPCHRRRTVEEADHRSENPYTEMEGYTVYDASGEEIGEVQDTVYDAPSDVLKYVIVDGRPIPADSIDVDAGEQSLSLPYDRETVEIGRASCRERV